MNSPPTKTPPYSYCRAWLVQNWNYYRYTYNTPQIHSIQIQYILKSYFNCQKWIPRPWEPHLTHKAELDWFKIGITTDTPTIHPKYTRYRYNTLSKVILIVKNEFPTHENPTLLILQSLIGPKLRILALGSNWGPLWREVGFWAYLGLIRSKMSMGPFFIWS